MTPGRSHTRQLVAALAVVVAALVVAVISRASPTPAPPAPRQVASIFQDDDHLLYSPTPVVIRTLDVLKSLGVDELRATVLWRALAPDPSASSPPPGSGPLTHPPTPSPCGRRMTGSWRWHGHAVSR